MTQSLGVVATSAKKSDAAAFARFLTEDPEARATLTKAGFRLPEIPTR